MRTLAVDPGIRGCGVALFDDINGLMNATYVKNPATKGNTLNEVVSLVREVGFFFPQYGVSELVVEQPCIYAHERFKEKDPNDLLPLRAIGGALAMFYESPANIVQYFPPEWKQNMPKGAGFEKRVMDRLTGSERANIKDHPRSIMHNVFDAIGLGLFHLGRFKPVRVIAR